MKSNTPAVIFVPSRDDYKRLQEKDSPFYGQDNKCIFMMALVTGFRNKCKSTLPSGKDDIIRTEYLTDQERSIIKAMAVADEGSLDILLDKKQVYAIAEEYAAGGIQLLKDEVFRGGYSSYIKKLESELVDDFKKVVKE